MFKKRFVTMAKSVANSVPSVIGKITIAETCTIVAAKVSVAGWTTSGTPGRVQEVRLFLFCKSRSATDEQPDPSTVATGHGTIIEYPQIDGMNGFYVGSLFATSISATGHSNQLKPYIEEKFRFKRKCDRNDDVFLSGHSIVREGSTETVKVAGAMVLTLQTR